MVDKDINFQLKNDFNEEYKDESNNYNMIKLNPSNKEIIYQSDSKPVGDDYYCNQYNYTSTGSKENLIQSGDCGAQNEPAAEVITVSPDNNVQKNTKNQNFNPIKEEFVANKDNNIIIINTNKTDLLLENKEFEVKKNENINTIRKMFDLIFIQIFIITCIVSIPYFFIDIKPGQIVEKQGWIGVIFFLYFLILMCIFLYFVEGKGEKKEKNRNSKCFLITFIILFSIGTHFFSYMLKKCLFV